MSGNENLIDGTPVLGGRPLRDVRAERLLSIRELARAAKVATSTICLIEAGRSMPRLSVVGRIATALKVDALTITEFRRVVRARGGLR